MSSEWTKKTAKDVFERMQSLDSSALRSRILETPADSLMYSLLRLYSDIKEELVYDEVISKNDAPRRYVAITVSQEFSFVMEGQEWAKAA